MGFPLVATVSPTYAPSITTATSARAATFVGTKDPQSRTPNAFSHCSTFLALCPQRSHRDRELFAPVCPRALRPGLPGLLWGSAPLGVVIDCNRRSTKRRTVLAGMAVAAGERRVLVTFDVDGTLVHSAEENTNSLHKNSFTFAMKEVFGVDGTIDFVKHHGQTDQRILVDSLEYYGIPRTTIDPKLPELKSKMVEYAKEHSAQVREGLDLLPGVASLLETLSKRDDVVVGLVTGNLQDIGWLKMEGVGIRPLFSTPNFGGFGSDHIERGELVRIAATRAKTLFPGEFSKRVHVGDTPNDIQAAEYGGALAIGVCTGVFSREDLQAASKSGSVVILDDLADSGKFLKACGLE